MAVLLPKFFKVTSQTEAQSPQTLPVQSRRSSTWLTCAEKIASSRPSVYCFFLVLYGLPAAYLAHRKLLWDDEFFTLYLSSTSGWHEILRALATGADQHPPTYYYLAHVAMAVLGRSHLVVRLPSIFGFGLLCICLYEIGRHLAEPLWGSVALLFPLGTNLYYYATEARAYGLVSGFMALAVFAWLRSTSQRAASQEASSPRHRTTWLLLLAAALMAAVGSHYYAVMAAGCIMLGEVVRTRALRRFDLPVWGALACTAIPVLAFARTIRSARSYSTHFWAVPIWSDAIRFFQKEVAITIVAILGAVALVLVLRKDLLRVPSLRHARKSLPQWSDWQATSLVALALLPFIVMLLAKFVTHGFSDRYAISALIGVVLVLVYVLHQLSPAPQVAMAALAACFVMYVYQAHNMADGIAEVRSKTLSDLQEIPSFGDGPVVVMDITPYHRLSFYAPRSLASHITYISDPSASIRYMGHDTVDRGLLDLRPWFPIDVVPVGTYLRAHSAFYVFGSVNGWNWVTYDLPQWGDAQLLARGKQDALLFSVTHVRPEAVPQADDPSAAAALFRRMPSNGPSLCTLWMGAHDCL